MNGRLAGGLQSAPGGRGAHRFRRTAMMRSASCSRSPARIVARAAAICGPLMRCSSCVAQASDVAATISAVGRSVRRATASANRSFHSVHCLTTSALLKSTSGSTVSGVARTGIAVAGLG